MPLIFGWQRNQQDIRPSHSDGNCPSETLLREVGPRLDFAKKRKRDHITGREESLADQHNLQHL